MRLPLFAIANLPAAYLLPAVHTPMRMQALANYLPGLLAGDIGNSKAIYGPIDSKSGQILYINKFVQTYYLWAHR